jgi:hypothetical protein
VGTPQRFADTVIATTLTPTVERSLAASAVNEVAANSGVAVRQTIDRHRGQLESAFIRALNSERLQTDARTVIARLYREASSNRTQAVNFRPLIVQYTAALHDVDPRVPRVPTGLAPQVEVRAKELNTVGRISKSFGSIAWLGLLAGLLGAVLVARFLIRGHRKQLWSVGTVIGEPAVGLMVIAELGRHATSVIHLGSDTGRLLVGSLVSRVAGALIGTALFLLGLDLVILLLWQTLTVLLRRRNASTSVAATSPMR